MMFEFDGRLTRSLPAWFLIAVMHLAIAPSLAIRPADAQDPADAQAPADGQGSGPSPTIEQNADSRPPAYSDQVVEKADAILKQAGLRRSGKSLQCLRAADLSRAMGSIQKRRRELDVQQQQYAAAIEQLVTMDQQISQLNVRDGELNLQLARIAGGDAIANNRLVALINATRSQIIEARKQKTLGVEAAKQLRAQLNVAEEQFSNDVFEARRQIDALSDELADRLADPRVKIAINVVNANFEVPADVTANQILRSLDSRLKSFEKSIFKESIPLTTASNGSLTAMVSVNGVAVEMVIDSGATLVTIPSTTATQLRLEIPNDAPEVALALANGQRISGRRLSLGQVRLGQFEAKDVEAVVLEPIAGNAKPLLGLSYLNRYKFEVDSSAKKLTLLRVDSAE